MQYIETVSMCLILLSDKFVFYGIYCPGCWLACELLSSSRWLLSFGRLNDELQSTNNRGFKILLGRSRCSAKLPCLVNACHLDQMLPIKPDLSTASVLRWMPKTSPLAAHSLKSVFSFVFSEADIKRKVDPEVSWSHWSLVRHTTFAKIRDSSLVNIIRLKEVTGRLTILCFFCSAEPNPALASRAEWDFLSSQWASVRKVCSLFRCAARLELRRSSCATKASQNRTHVPCPMHNICVYSHKKHALCHTSNVIYGFLTLFSNKLFQLLQQIEPELGCMSEQKCLFNNLFLLYIWKAFTVLLAQSWPLPAFHLITYRRTNIS